MNLPITMDDSIPQQAGPGAGAVQLHSAIMNLPCKHGDWSDENGNMAYKIGHRDARHAAAELALSHLAAPLAVEDSRDAARYRWLRDSAVHTEGFCAWAVSGINAGDAIPCIGSELDELVDAAMAAASSGAQPEQQQGQGLVHPAMSTSGRTSVQGGVNAPSADGWSGVARDGMPPCDGETVYIGINTAGFACCFNEVTHDGVCSMQGPELSTAQMSGLQWWRVLERPAEEQQ